MLSDPMVLDRRRRLMGGAIAGVFTGVAVSTSARSASSTPKSAAQTGPSVTALVLGGGGCRGYGHIGFIKGLEEHGLRPDLVVGSSIGSLVGALYASGMSADRLERLGRRVNANTLRDWVFPNLGIFGGDRIAQFVKKHVAVRTIEALPLRFAAVTTDLQSGERFVFHRGDLGTAVQASSSLPGIMEPVRVGNRYYVDGNLSSPVPVDVARSLGAARVVAVDVTFPPEQADLRDPFDALYQAFSILTRRIALKDRAGADLAVEPKLPVHNDMSPSTLDALVAAGRQTAVDVMPQLKHLFSSAQGAPRK